MNYFLQFNFQIAEYYLIKIVKSRVIIWLFSRFVTDDELIASDLEKDLKPKSKRGRKRKIKPNPETNIKRLRKKRKGVNKIEAETSEDLKEEDGIEYSDNEFK